MHSILLHVMGRAFHRLDAEERGSIGWLVIGVIIGIILVIWGLLSLIF
jgi:hypothetical protein